MDGYQSHSDDDDENDNVPERWSGLPALQAKSPHRSRAHLSVPFHKSRHSPERRKRCDRRSHLSVPFHAFSSSNDNVVLESALIVDAEKAISTLSSSATVMQIDDSLTSYRSSAAVLSAEEEEEEEKEGMESDNAQHLCARPSMPATTTTTTSPLKTKKSVKEDKPHPSMVTIHNTRKPTKPSFSTAAVSTTTKAPSTPNLIFFPSGIFFHDLLDASKHPPQTQYTVTGRMRRKKRQVPLGTVVMVNGHRIVLFRYKEDIYACEEACAHQGGPLSLGDIEEIISDDDGGKHLCVICPWHNYAFDAQTGDGIRPCNGSYAQTFYPTRIDNNNNNEDDNNTNDIDVIDEKGNENEVKNRKAMKTKKGEIFVGFKSFSQSLFSSSEF